MTTIVKAAQAKDFLALVPQLVGFTPSQSIVFVAFRGNRTCAAMRFGLPDDSSEKHYRRVATTLVGMLSKVQGVDSVVPVVYTDAPYLAARDGAARDGAARDGAARDGAAEHPPRARFVAAVIDRFRFSGFGVRDALCVAGDAWGSYLDPDCPLEGRPLREIADSSVLDAVPASMLSRVGGVEQWSALPAVEPATTARVARLLRELIAVFDSPAAYSGDGDGAGDGDGDSDGDAVGPPGAVPSELAAVLGVDPTGRQYGLPLALELILKCDPASIHPAAAAFVIAVSRSPALRDVVMLQWAFDLETGERVLADAESFAAGKPPLDLDTAPLMLGRGPRPDPERIDVAVELLKAIAARAPRENRPPVLCMLAWLNWALGRSSVANRFVVAAQEIDPSYSLADLLGTMLDRGMLPEWAFAVG